MIRRPAMEWATVGFLTVVSLAVRLTTVSMAPLPVNDGGLFYAFTSDLLANGMRLPDISSYNGAGIPLVYPPLAFYVTAALHLTSGLSVLDLLHYVPAIVSAAAIPAFFALASKMLTEAPLALLATLVFSMLPRAFDWLIMGGGITRSFGLLFFLLFTAHAFRLFARGDRSAVLPTILFSTLLLVSHPEALVHAVITAALLVAWQRRTRALLARSLLVVIATILISSPWWLHVLARHGLDPWAAGVMAAHQDTYDPLRGLVALVRFDFTDEPFLRLFGVLGLLGVVLQLARRSYFLPAWLGLMHLLEPRGGSLFMMIPLALCAGVFIGTVLMPALRSGPGVAPSPSDVGSSGKLATHAWLPATPTTALVLFFLFLYGTVSAYFVAFRLQSEVSLAERDVAAMGWISHNTATGDKFALVTGGEPLLDATADWFPTIAGRRSVASYFGAEWIPGFDFASGLGRYRALQDCANQEAQCIKDWESSGIEIVKYVYVRAPSSRVRTALQEFVGFRWWFSPRLLG